MENERYSRQTALEGFGAESADNLKNSVVCVAGAGGVGAGAIPLLAGAGVGTIRIADGDVVNIHNLHRQTLFAEADAGKNKAELAAAYAKRLNSDCAVGAFAENISEKNADEFFADCDICIDATDSFASRLLISDLCRSRKIFEIAASAEGCISQIMVFGKNFYLDDVVECSEGGELGGAPIFGPAAHMAGVLAASTALKWLAGAESYPSGSFHCFDHRAMKFFSGKF